MFGPPFSPSDALAVDQTARICVQSPSPELGVKPLRLSFPWMVTVAHGDPIKPISLVWRVDGESRDINAPAGVVFSRQISANSVEPIVASLSRNLLSHDDRGPGGTDEAMKVRPQMPWIILSGSFAGDRERLAGAGPGPQGPAVRPPSKSSCNAPQSAAREEVALGVASEVIGLDILYGAVVNISEWDHPTRNLLTEDSACGFIGVVVVGTTSGRRRQIE